MRVAAAVQGTDPLEMLPASAEAAEPHDLVALCEREMKHVDVCADMYKLLSRTVAQRAQPPVTNSAEANAQAGTATAA